MTLNPSTLPRDVRSLRRMIVEKEALLSERQQLIAEKEALLAERDRLIAVRDAELYSKTLQIEHLKAQLAVLRRARFGRSSEKLDREIEQLELLLGELEEGVAESQVRAEQAEDKACGACPLAQLALRPSDHGSSKNETPKSGLGDHGPEWHFCSPIPETETKPCLRNAALRRAFAVLSRVGRWRLDWLAGVVRLELANVDSS